MEWFILQFFQVGIFPCDFVSESTAVQPTEIDFSELALEEVIGAGGFGKVWLTRRSVSMDVDYLCST